MLILPLAVALKTCHQAPIPVSDFCTIANSTFYYGGEFKFSPDELAHLTRANKEKLVGLKKTYKSLCLN